MKELKIDADTITPSAVSSAISRAKNDNVSPRQFESRAFDHIEEQIARIYVRYEHSMQTSGALDFDDLLLKALQLFKEHEVMRERWGRRFQYLLVDEYQDTNAIQYQLVRWLGYDCRNVCVTGDPDQAIYSWRGADVQNILSFERDFPEARVIKLEQNFRSLGNILKAADGLIEHNTLRKEKTLFTEAGDGPLLLDVTVTDEYEEARTAVRFVREHRDAGHSLREAAVFYRTNALSRSLERAFLEAGIPYDVVGTVAFYDRREIKDLLGYLRIIVNPDDDLSLTRILNVPPRGIGARTLQHLRAFADSTNARLRQVVALVADPAGGPPVPGLGPRQRNALIRFDAFLRELEDRIVDSPGKFLEHLVDALNFLDYLTQQGDPRAEERKENVLELVASAYEFANREGVEHSLVGFLEDVALVSQVDMFEEHEDRVNLMTIHNAKGLEFDFVILAGFEDGLLPHKRSLDDGGPEAIEEERRLCYVALTRARKRFAMINTLYRRWGGAMASPREPSRFRDEIPSEVIERVVLAAPPTSPGFGAPLAPRSQHPYEPGGPAPSAWRDDVPEYEHDSSDAASGSAASDRSHPAGESRDGEAAMEPPKPASPSFESGQLVRHELFGVGRVVRVEGRGPGRKVRIRFTTSGERLLVLEYANLTIVN